MPQKKNSGNRSSTRRPGGSRSSTGGSSQRRGSRSRTPGSPSRSTPVRSGSDDRNGGGTGSDRDNSRDDDFDRS